MTPRLSRAAWLAGQVGHRAGVLALLASLAGIGAMLAGKRAFVSLLAVGCSAAVLGLLGAIASRRWGETGVAGLIAFNATVLAIAMLTMTLARTGWGNWVGALSGRGPL